MTTATVDDLALLRAAGEALAHAQLRFDLVLAIGNRLGCQLMPQRAALCAVEKRKAFEAGIGRAVAAIEKAGRPLALLELAASCWPHEHPDRVRGFLSVAMAREWVLRDRDRHYRVGPEWRHREPVAEDLAQRIAQLQAQLAELTAAAVAKEPKP